MTRYEEYLELACALKEAVTLNPKFNKWVVSFWDKDFYPLYQILYGHKPTKEEALDIIKGIRKSPFVSRICPENTRSEPYDNLIKELRGNGIPSRV